MPSAIPLRLSAGEKRKLWNLRLSTKSKRVWARTTGLLMLGSGETATKVATCLGVCVDTVTNWKHRWRQSGFFQIADRPKSGRPPRATPVYRKRLEEAVTRGPRAYRYQFTVWSAGRLAAHLYHKTGISLGEKQVRYWLAKLGFAFRRPKHTLRGRQNRGEVRVAKKRLDALKRGLSSLAQSSSSSSKTKETSIYILI
jgi:transposase